MRNGGEETTAETLSYMEFQSSQRLVIQPRGFWKKKKEGKEVGQEAEMMSLLNVIISQCKQILISTSMHLANSVINESAVTTMAVG